VTGEAKILLDSACTNPSDPNSIKDLGPTVYALPQEVNLQDIQEEFTEKETDTIYEDPELDKEMDEDDAIN